MIGIKTTARHQLLSASTQQAGYHDQRDGHGRLCADQPAETTLVTRLPIGTPPEPARPSRRGGQSPEPGSCRRARHRRIDTSRTPAHHQGRQAEAVHQRTTRAVDRVEKPVQCPGHRQREHQPGQPACKRENKRLDHQLPHQTAAPGAQRDPSIDDSDRELSAASFGSLAHEVLHRFAKDKVKDASDPAPIADFLSATLDDVVYAEFGREILPAVRLQTAQLRLRLDAFARWQAEHRGTGWRIEHAERTVEGEAAVLDVDGVPFYLHGRIDRIDVNDLTGARLIVDYKTSEATPDPHRAHQKKGAWVDLQLPLYRHLAASMGISGSVTLAYVALPKKTADIKLFPAQWTEDELRTADEVAREVVRGIRAGHFEPTEGPPPAFSEQFAELCMDNQLTMATPIAASGATGANEAPS